MVLHKTEKLLYHKINDQQNIKETYNGRKYLHNIFPIRVWYPIYIKNLYTSITKTNKQNQNKTKRTKAILFKKG